ncbi:MAG: phosphoenolpyruvate-protein phosphotransferase [Gammaproteobacteria bacterium SG8_47]|nr:MAG: phosphoenolpyruvate-protein phosphotransferase [Gammaproteobacteria bacterium SG8_47]
MLDTLRRITQEVSAARSLEQALGIIVSRVKEAVAADVCSVYLTDQTLQQHVLMATDGLNADAVGRVRLGSGEGLVSLVAERAEPVHLDNAPDHPRYRYFPETGEERYHAFLGVPIIHHRAVVGVLVVQHHAQHRFDDDSVNFLITIAAQLAGAIAHAEASGGLNHVAGSGLSPASVRPLIGLPGAPGVAIGTAVVVYPQTDIESVPDRAAADVDAELCSLDAAVAQVREEIRVLAGRLPAALPAEERMLFDAYLLMLESGSFLEPIRERVRAGQWAPGALRATIAEHVRVFDEMDDPYLRERREDIRDLGRRVMTRLCRNDDVRREYPERTVLVGEDVSAAQLAEVDSGRLAGVVSVRGSRTSHVAILARALGIPAVMGATDLPVNRLDGAEILADGYNGRVFVSPVAAVRKEFERLAREEAQLSAELRALRDLPAETPDGVRVPLYANTGLLADITPTLRSGAEGIGLYRTEFPFMVRQRFPGEEEQRTIYRQVLEAFAPRPVVLRTLDVGGDKALPYFPIREDNPFLGWRGMRITLDHPEIFLVQLRAMLRAAVGLGNLSLLLPMITEVAELDEALALVRRAEAELREEGESVVTPRVGVMIEVPSAVYQARALARRADFLSVGSNDLTQYLLAVDRNNPRVADLYDSLHPAVLQALHQVVEAARAEGKPVSVCGEMAGDPAAVLLLLGMGMDYLSMSASSLPRAKWVIRNFSRERAAQLVGEAMVMERAAEVRSFLSNALEAAGLGGLVRAGK